MILRDYQSAGSDAVFEAWHESHSALGVYPTGCGKTILFADVIRRAFPRRSMVIAHREELIWQAADKIAKTTGLKCEVEMAQYKAHSDSSGLNRAPVVISTIQTQCSGNDGGGRMGKFNPQNFGVLIIDEAHHATAPSYRRLIEYYRQNPNLRILGVTATPDRADEEALGQIFQTVAFDYELINAIEDGWLVPIQQQMVTIAGLDFSRVRTTAGDLNGADLAAIMEAESTLHGIASASLEIIGKRRALVFTSGVRHAELLSEIFNRHNPRMAQWVCGYTNKEKRKQILADFADGTTQVICNCGVLTEGFDDPGVECIIMGRPTKSRALYAQMVGRSTRPLSGLVETPPDAEGRKAAIAASAKPSCLVVDFCGNSGRHKLVTTAEILGTNYSEDVVALAEYKAKLISQPVAMSRLLTEAETEIELKKQKEREERRLRDEARRANLIAHADWRSTNVDPFDILQMSVAPARGWDKTRVLSEKQAALLAKHMGVDASRIPYTQGRQLINELFRRWNGNLCTFKQAKWLGSLGYDVTNMTKDEASKIISGIKQGKAA